MAKSKTKSPKRSRKATKSARAKTGARKVASRRPAGRAKATKRPARVPRGNDSVRDLAKRIIAVTVAHDDDATLALYAGDVSSCEMGQPPMVGIEALKEKLRMWRGMTSSASFRPRAVMVDGNTIMIEWEGTVTLAANGKTVKLDEIAIHEIRSGKIARERFYYDPAALRQ